MATLKDRLDAIRRGFEKQATPEILALMHRVTSDLETSGIEQRALNVGAQAPAFALADQDGQRVDAAALMAAGPVVVTFYRGHW
jgi:hypothetical protein